MTPLDLIQKHAVQMPDTPAVLECDEEGIVLATLTWRALQDAVNDAAGRLAGMGLSPGDTIALDFHNGAELLVISWAAWSSGIATAPLDTKRDTVDLRAFKLAQSNSSKTLAPGLLAQMPTGEWTPAHEHARALILYTSGTTARPKGAILTLANLLVNARGIAQWLRITSSDRFLVQLPLHHINSTTFCLASLVAGASIVLPPRYSHSRFWQQAARTQATFTSVVPSIVHDQLSRTSEFKALKDTLKLSRIQVGSAPVVVSEVQAFIEQFGIPLYQGYGQTETALRVTGVPIDLDKKVYEQLVAKNSIGTPMPWANLEVASTEGSLLKEGEEGELVVKGDAVMQKYIGGEEAFRDGWFLTGDIGYWKIIEGRRFFFLKGRAKEIVIKGGVNISPVAVEDALKKISADIAQAYVVGKDDERYGEVVAAAIVWKVGVDPASAMRALKVRLLRGSSHLSAYETPDYLANIKVEDLPTTSTGKVQRSQLKKNIGDAFERLVDIYISQEYRFVAVEPQSPLAEKSRGLYNQCWQPLEKTAREYRTFLNANVTIAALDASGAIAGHLALKLHEGRLTCISICSANFVPKPVPEAARMPSKEEVERYVQTGEDPVMQFHAKLGAELVEVIPQGRPEDKSALGYTMLLHYPAASDSTLKGSAPAQLIALARTLGKDIGADVYALSRPGGLAAWVSRS